MRITSANVVVAALLTWVVSICCVHAWAQDTKQQGIAGLPATFIGTLPCADCPGIRYQLNLLSDHTFASRMAYEERNASFDDHGTWQLANEGKTLVLQGGRGSRDLYAVRDADTLRKLDADGHEIESTLNYDLKRAPEFLPIESAAKPSASASLENTYWKLIRLGTTPVTSASQQQEAHIVLASETHRVSGSGGCNRLMGSYQLNGDQLSFSQMAGTMMACAQGMETERAFLNALEQVKSWKITGQGLDLLDANGQSLAHLEAREMK